MQNITTTQAQTTAQAVKAQAVATPAPAVASRKETHMLENLSRATTLLEQLARDEKAKADEKAKTPADSTEPLYLAPIDFGLFCTIATASNHTPFIAQPVAIAHMAVEGFYSNEFRDNGYFYNLDKAMVAINAIVGKRFNLSVSDIHVLMNHTRFNPAPFDESWQLAKQFAHHLCQVVQDFYSNAFADCAWLSVSVYGLNFAQEQEGDTNPIFGVLRPKFLCHTLEVPAQALGFLILSRVCLNGYLHGRGMSVLIGSDGWHAYVKRVKSANDHAELCKAWQDLQNTSAFKKTFG